MAVARYICAMAGAQPFEFTTNGLGDIPAMAKALLQHFGSERVFCFEAEMGAGKTTTIAALVKALGSNDIAQSPTYSLVNAYLAENGSPIYHFDFYRLSGEDEGFEAGLPELIDSGNYCFIEWPSVAPGLLPDTYVSIHIDVLEGSRNLRAEIVG